ncbi:MAG: TIGR03936 family radical SAM-associated protein [Actinomycetota bacterium]|nr:TIGR03936 family radical SAM-associated protein [Actinomycetota bacterium]
MRGGAANPVRLRYTKLGKIRWISHRDVARALERAFRIAQLPLAFSEGFSPRPRVSFGLALSTGHESEAEYVDLVLAEAVDLDALASRLNGGLPEGIDVVGAVALADRAPALQEAVTCVEWRVDVARGDLTEVDPARLREEIDAALAMPSLMATRHRKGREVVEDVRPVIRRITVCGGSSATALPAVVEMEMSTQPRGAKPGEVLAAIGDLTDVRARRTNQWIERDGARQEPLDADTRPRVPEACVS